METDTATSNDATLQLRHLLLTQDPMLQSKDNSGVVNNEYLDQLSVIVKKALTAKKSDDLVETMQGILRLKDHEIEAICSGNHSEYMLSIQQLNEVSAQAEDIRGIVMDIGQRVSQSGGDLLEKKTFLEDAQRMRVNLDASIEAVSSSLEVLNLTNRVHQLLKEKSKFEAFKALEDLRAVQQQSPAEFGFSKVINKSVPELGKDVRNETVNDFGNWVAEIDQMNIDIGRKAFQIMEDRISEWKKMLSNDAELRRYKFNSPVEQAYRESSSIADFSDIKIDLSPLYECVLVHSSLGLSIDFKHHFENDRKIRRNYLVPNNIKIVHDVSMDQGERSEDISQIKNTISTITGFCIIDRIISRNIPSLRPYKDVDDLWESINQELIPLLQSLLKNVENMDTFKELKKLLASFLYTMQEFGFNTAGIERLILLIFQRYSQLVKEKFRRNFFEALEKDDSMPMKISKPDLYETIVNLAWYDPQPSVDGREPRYPRTVPFSEIYPLFCAEIRTFFNYHTAFLDELQNDPTAIEDVLHSAMDDLLINTVCKTFEERLRSSSREEIIQIIVNLEYFQTAAKALEKILNEERISGRRGHLRLQAPTAFGQARKKAEERIFEFLNGVIDEFLELADYDWTTTSKVNQPSLYLVDMVKYVRTLVTSTFVNLPTSVKSFIYLDAFDHLCSTLLNILLEAPTNMSLEALHNLDVDVQALESFLFELSKSMNDPSIGTTVTELRQSVDLLQSGNVEEYNDSQIRGRKYGNLKPENARILASKIAYARLKEESMRSQPGSPALRDMSPKVGAATSKLMKYYRDSAEKIKENLTKDRDS